MLQVVPFQCSIRVSVRSASCPGGVAASSAPTAHTSLAETAATPRNWSKYTPFLSAWDARANEVVQPGVGVGVLVGAGVGVGVGGRPARAGCASAPQLSAAASNTTTAAPRRACHKLRRGSVLPLM